MDRVRLGRTNMMVSRLGFGTIPMRRLPTNDAVALIRRCLDLGVAFVDTANRYFPSEEALGKAIKGRRDEVVIATKSISRTREGVQKDLELSLERLSVDFIDLYQVHDIKDFKALDQLLAPMANCRHLKMPRRQA